MNRRSKVTLVLAAVLAMIYTQTTHADLVRDLGAHLGRGLGLAGLNPRVTRDVFQDGWRLDFGNNFIDQTYDFGNVELTLNGTLQGQFSVGQRGIDEFAFSLDTPGGLAFDLVEFIGVDKTQIQNGLLNINQDFKINRYGFYDLQLMITGRGEVTGDHIDGAQPIDFDLGPIDIHGHWLVDVINLTLGRAFGFVLPGGATEQIVMGYFEQAPVAVEDIVIEEIVTAEPAGVTIVPEPATLIPLLLGMPFLWRRGIRRT